MLSPLKYPGGKRDLVVLLDMLYASHRGRRLVEPFVGGMSVALGLEPEGAVLSDVNLHLVNFYLRLRDPRPFTIKMENDEGFYYEHREMFNDLIKNGDDGISDAAEIFYYLNRTCFNGVCRFNSAGEFNVPFGKHKLINYRRDFSEYAPALSRWGIQCAPFWQVPARAGDFVYLDPPYDTDFTEYSGRKFTWEDQVLLAEMYAAHAGPIVASNQATARVLDLYRRLGYEVRTTEMRRSVSRDGDRTPALEMVAMRNVKGALPS